MIDEWLKEVGQRVNPKDLGMILVHLTLASPKRITKTIQALKEEEINCLVPLHCTGFEAMASIWQAFP